MNSIVENLCVNDLDFMRNCFTDITTKDEESIKFIECVMKDDIDKVKEMYIGNPDLLNILDSDGLTPIMHSGGKCLEFLFNCPGVDLFRVDLSGRSLLDILLENGVKTKELKLLKSERTLTKISNIPMLQIEHISDKLRKILLFDDIDEFKNVVYDVDILLLACQFKAWNIVRYIVDKNLCTNDYVSKDRFTPICYSFYYENTEVSEILFHYLKIYKYRNIYNEFCVNYGSNCIDIKNNILRKVNTKNDKSNLTVFKHSDFKILKFVKTLDVGISGTIVHVVHRKTFEKFVLKKIKLEYNQIQPSHIKEVNIHKFINEFKPDIAVNLYGYYCHDDCLYLVLEPMVCTLHAYLKIIKKDKVIFHDSIKDILHEIFKLIDGLGQIGVAHRDLKTNNIMLSHNGKLCLIDFGLSQFIGLCMSKDLANDLLTIKYIYPPDRIGNIRLKHVNGSTKLFQTNRKSLNLDIYAIGVNLLSMIVNDDIVSIISTMFVNSSNHRPKTFISDYDGIYATNNRESSYNSENLWYSFNVMWLKDFHDHVKLYDLFKWMINSNSDVRSYAKDCLNHPYFTGNLPSRPVSNYINQEEKISLISYENDDQFEAHYRNEMVESFKTINNYSSTSNESLESDHDYIESVNFILDVFKKTKSTSLDVIFNFIGKFKKFVLDNKIPNDRKREIYFIYSILIYTICDIQFEDTSTLKGNDIFNRCVSISGGNYNVDQFKSVFETLKKEEYIFTLIPIKTMLMNIIIEFKKLSYITYNIEVRVVSLLVKIQTYIRTECSVWKLLSNIFHYVLPIELFDFIDNIDPNLIEQINEISINNQNLNEKSIHQLNL